MTKLFFLLYYSYNKILFITKFNRRKEEKMEEKRIKEIIDTIEFIESMRESTIKGLKILWWFMTVYGFYIFINSTLNLILPHLSIIWFFTFVIAGPIATAINGKWKRLIITWSISFAIMIGIFFINLNIYIKATLLIIIFILAHFLCYIKTNDRKRIFPIAEKIGTFWGIIMGSAALFFIATQKLFIKPDYASLFFTIFTGIGMIATGLFSKRIFLYIGLILITGIATEMIFSFSNILLIQGLAGLGMGISGLISFLESRKDED